MIAPRRHAFSNWLSRKARDSTTTICLVRFPEIQSLFLVVLVVPCAQDGSTLPDLRIVLGNWLAFAMIGNPGGAGGTGIVRGTGGSITRGDRLICASGHGLTWKG